MKEEHQDFLPKSDNYAANYSYRMSFLFGMMSILLSIHYLMQKEEKNKLLGIITLSLMGASLASAIMGASINKFGLFKRCKKISILEEDSEIESDYRYKSIIGD